MRERPTLTRRGVLALAAAGTSGAALAWLAACGSGGGPGAVGAGGAGHAAGHGAHGAAGGTAFDAIEGVRDAQQTGLMIRSRIALPKAYGWALPRLRPLAPARGADGVDRYRITARPGTAELLPGVQTPVFGYGGTLPGPLIESHRGRPVAVQLRNELPFPTVTHLHGGSTPAEHDGFPCDLVLPAGGWSHALHRTGRTSEGEREYRYPLDQRAATLWYHDHRMDFTGPQVWLGLAGAHVHRDDEELALPLPRGDRELVLMIADRSFDADGSLLYPSVDRELAEQGGVTGGFHEGVLGDVILVNGRAWPELEVEPARYRLRLVNASNARHYRLTLEGLAHDEPPFVQLGGDGGLLEAPVRHRRLPIAPGERFDVVVDFTGLRRGARIELGNADGEDGTARVMRFRVAADRADDPSSVPERLSTVERLDPAAAVRTRSFSFGRDADAAASGSGAVWRIDRQGYDPDASLATVRLGEVEAWEFTSDTRHPVHVHLSPFQVIARGDGPPAATDAGWKDTVSLGPGERVRVLVRFDAHVGRFMLHCHNLEHEDLAMMANFDVV